MKPSSGEDSAEEVAADELNGEYDESSEEVSDDDDSLMDSDEGSESDDDEVEEEEDSLDEASGDSEGESSDDEVSTPPAPSDSGVTSGSASTSEPALDEYEYDSSDQEDIRNTVGNIPMEWYKQYEHLGYSVDGRRLIKPAEGDQLDELINRADDPNYWRSVKDDQTGQRVVLTKEDVDIIQRLRKRRIPHADVDPYPDWDDTFTRDTMNHPLVNIPARKSDFIPSRDERRIVSRFVHAIKMGWIKPNKKRHQKTDSTTPMFYDIWAKEEEEASRRRRIHIPAPKRALPRHDESYNPPPEYLPTPEEQEQWEQTEAEDRRRNYLPQQFKALRQVPSYQNFTKEMFERCLDLYLAPRAQKVKMKVRAEDLIPKLPQPRDLQPFPTTLSLVYKGHTDLVYRVSPDPTGQWLASGSADGSVRVWEVSTGRCIRHFALGTCVADVAWNPNRKCTLIAAAVDDRVVLLNPGKDIMDNANTSQTDELLDNFTQPDEGEVKTAAEWIVNDQRDPGARLEIKLPKPAHQLSWHGRGDYLVSVQRDAGSACVIIHQISKRRSQAPFSKPLAAQAALFHPSKPFLFVATQRHVRVYDLMKHGELLKKLMTNVKWVSSMALHPQGDNVIIGSYDSRLSWFDMDLSSKPYQTLRHHKAALRQVAFSGRYPLFASCSDDGSAIVCHGRVYDDLLKQPLIVPVKVLRGHGTAQNLRVLGCSFHPTQPWLFTAGADGNIHLYT